MMIIPNRVTAKLLFPQRQRGFYLLSEWLLEHWKSASVYDAYLKKERRNRFSSSQKTSTQFLTLLLYCQMQFYCYIILINL